MRRNRPKRTASGSLTNGHRPDRGRRTAGGRGGGPRGRGRGKSAVPTAVLASARPSLGQRARSDTASGPRLPPSSPLPQLPAATHRTGTGCFAKGFPAGHGTQNPGTAANRNRLHNTGRALGGCRGGGGAGGQRAELRTRGTPARCGETGDTEGAFKAEITMRKEEFHLKFFMCVIQSRRLVRTSEGTAGEASTSSMLIPKPPAKTDSLKNLGTVEDPDTVGGVPIFKTGPAPLNSEF
ncbi:translation initiation factor IF-2-like [Sciurus carolinensis]|uniref:translation initiation factor IF-2-like n=1 Tax=Sciurus carolinensis TaxID=30640 RepID=UPI001FB549BB|nr:translation initiation factor IF-2-like [Sciurus carolinensis]